MPLTELKSHPDQARLFRDLPAVELQRLMESLKTEGQLQDVEITPEGVIICGHQRVRAAKELGWDTIRCCVRDDLDESGAQRRLIADNLDRRQLSKLDVARCYLRLKEIEKSGSSRQIKGDVRDHLAKRFDVSGRTLDRWGKILKAPLEIQKAFEDNVLKLTIATAIADLPSNEMELIARRIREGEGAKRVATEVLAKRCPDAVKTRETPLAKLLRELKRAAMYLPGVSRSFDAATLKENLTALKKGAGVLRILIARAEEGSTPEA